MNRGSKTIPWLVTLCVFAALMFLNADGYAVHLYDSWMWYGIFFFQSEPPEINWIHGWPVPFCYRKPELDMLVTGGVHQPTSRWPIGDVEFMFFQPVAAVVDAMLAITVTIGAYLGAKRLPQWPVRFSIRAMLLSIAIVAVLLVFRHFHFVYRYVPELVAFAVVMLGVALIVAELVSWLRNSLSSEL